MLVDVREKLKEIAVKIKQIAHKLGLIADYIVKEGTDNNWEYVKYANGTYTATWKGLLEVGTGTSWCGQYYHQATANLTVPSFATSFEIVSAKKEMVSLLGMLVL